MIQEHKQLLLKDICARLPYGIRYKGDSGWPINPYQHTTSLCTILNSEEPLVYLRPMSSMTDEEENKYNSLNAYEKGTFPHTEEAFDWLLANHFDFHNLIEKGLALEAPEGMYEEK